jgi:hypothetical protein
MRRRLVSAAVTAALVLGCLVAAPSAPATGATVAPGDDRPVMGWSSWSSMRCDPVLTEANLRQQASIMHDKLQAHGYRYLNVDACWIEQHAVDQFGRNRPDPVRFPHGIKALADYVHGLGQRFGLYGIPGVPIAAYQANSPIEGTPYRVRDIVAAGTPFATTFKESYKIDFGKPGAQQYVDSIGRLLASWGVDFLKYDSIAPGSSDNSYDTRADVQAMAGALERSGRRIWLTLSWHLDVASADFYRQYADAWRVDDDIECYTTCPTLTAWANPTGYVRDTILSRFFDAAEWTAFNGLPGSNGKRGWSDLDSLEIGEGAASGLSDDERRTAMTLWSIVGSPLYLGNDLSKLDRTGLALLTNDEVIAVDQSGTGGRPVNVRTDQQVWHKRLPDGSSAVALFNLGDAPAPVTARFADVGFCGTATVRDLWRGTSLGVRRDELTTTLAPHASALYTVRPAAAGRCPATEVPGAVAYEAEAAGNTVTGPAGVRACAGCSGGQKVGDLYQGGAVRFNAVRVARAGEYALTLHYAAGEERTGYLSANGGPEALVGFLPKTGGWDTPGRYTVRIRLRAGDNTIRYATRAGTYSPDLDRIAVSTKPVGT